MSAPTVSYETASLRQLRDKLSIGETLARIFFHISTYYVSLRSIREQFLNALGHAFHVRNTLRTSFSTGSTGLERLSASITLTTFSAEV